MTDLDIPAPTDADAPDEDGVGREPHHNLLAEQSALGGMLIGNDDTIDDVFAVVQPEDFYLPKHEVLANAIARMHREGAPVDVLTVVDFLAKAGELRLAGSAEYIHELTSIPSTAANAGFYAGIVAESAVRRRLVMAGIRLQAMGHASEGHVAELIDSARAEVEQISLVRPRDLHRISDGLFELGRSLDEAPTYQPTGWRALDYKIGGFAGGELHVVAARPGQGKSIVLLNAAMKAARYGVVSFTSLEMKLDQLQVRLMSQYGEIHMKALRDHQLSDIDVKAFARAMGYVKNAGVFVDVTPSATISTIRAHARAVAKRGEKLAMVVVDYLQLVDGPGANRELEVSGVARELKKLALDLDVPVLVAAQLNRGVPNRAGVIMEPGLRDLRESGGIEANADGVILLHRDPKRPHVIKFIIAKARQGEPGTVEMRWEPHYARVLDPVAQAQEPLFDMGGMQ